MTEIELNRHSNLIDPTLHIWGWEIPIYLFLGGLVAGILILTPILRARVPADQRSLASRLAPFAALALISLGMFFLFLDLTYKRHVLRFFAAFRLTSPMSWGSWILLCIYPAGLLLGLDGLTENDISRLGKVSFLKRLRLDRIIIHLRERIVPYQKQVHAVNIVLGIGLGAYTGLLLSTLGVRHVWSTSILAPLFLVSGVSTGAAFLLALPLRHAEHHLIGRLDIAAVVVELLLIALFFLGMISGDETERHAAALFITGPYAATFWTIVVIAGLAVPLLLESLEIKRGLPATRLAPILLLIGGFSLRWILVSAGQVSL
jgi:protein NrfD